MSDLTIIGIILFVIVAVFLWAGIRAGMHLAAPPRKRDDD